MKGQIKGYYFNSVDDAASTVFFLFFFFECVIAGNEAEEGRMYRSERSSDLPKHLKRQSVEFKNLR